eukprot:scaffold33742_cov115-Cyclotella_meneghiniana.AAC.3
MTGPICFKPTSAAPSELDIDVHGSLLCEWVHNREEQDGTSAKHLVKIKVQELSLQHKQCTEKPTWLPKGLTSSQKCLALF